MPVTKTAKRALRASKRKAQVNKTIIAALEKTIRAAKKARGAERILTAISLADRAVKKRVIHRNKAARIKSTLSKLLPKTALVRKSSKKRT